MEIGELHLEHTHTHRGFRPTVYLEPNLLPIPAILEQIKAQITKLGQAAVPMALTGQLAD